MLSPREWRKALGYNQGQMADYIGVGRPQWCQYENGVRVPSIDILAKCEELSGGRVTARSWHAVSLALPKIPPGRFYGTRRHRHMAHAARG